MGCCPDTDSDLNLLSVMLVTKTMDLKRVDERIMSPYNINTLSTK